MNKALTILSMAVLSFGLSTAPSAADDAELFAAGKEVFNDYCFACHGIADDEADRVAEEDRLAPPIFAVLQRYSRLPSREAFIAAVSSFAFAPSEDKVLMRGAARRFGLMPELGLTEEEANSVAHYLFANDLTVPEWFAAHMAEEHGGAAAGN